jgi:hypothetical protein
MFRMNGEVKIENFLMKGGVTPIINQNPGKVG